MTLSIPDGLIRALRENRLPSKVEVWHAEREEWVSLAAHPAALKALESIGSYLPAPEGLEPVEPEVAPPAAVPAAEVESVPEVEPAPEVGPPATPIPDPLDELLAAAHEFMPPPIVEPPAAPAPPETPAVEPQAPWREPPAARPSRLDITLPPRQQERRALEMAPQVERRRSTAQTPPTPEPAPAPKPGFTLPFTLPSRRVLIGSGIAAAIAVFYFLKGRSGDSRSADSPETVAVAPNHPPSAAPAATESVPAEVLPSFPVDSADTAPHVDALELQGLPGAPEADLETRLQLADALMWNPARDFGSPENLPRARRKVDAVLNSIQAYRVDMRRQAESGGVAQLGDRLEPFDEASRIDDVVRAMGAAIRVLEDVAGRFSVRGGTLEFDRGEDARRYNELRDRADSLLRAPVEMDPHPVIRPPRRLVTRLLTTLPGGMARGP